MVSFCDLPLVLDEREVGRVARARVHDLEVAPDARRHVEQERSKRVGKAVLRGRVGGRGRLRPAELEPAARPAVVLRLQQEVAVVALSPPNLMLWSPAILVKTVAN